MILAVDVHYSNNSATAAGVVFDDWASSAPQHIYVSELATVADYSPGLFYKRELPCILKLLQESGFKPTCIVIDGYVYLDGRSKPGLGKYLYDALDSKISVIGVAKTAFFDITPDFQLMRGESKKPLYITSAGMELSLSKVNILAMHGKYRIPTILKTVDQLCRRSR